MVASTGYESPSEENPPPPFIAGAGHATPAPTNRPVALTRPALVQRPSYVAAAAPDDHRNPARMLNSASTPTSNSLNHVMAVAEKSPTTPKVGIRDRIACHRWTYFTMVRTPLYPNMTKAYHCQDHVYRWRCQHPSLT